MNRADTYGALARLLLPQASDPDPRELVGRIPDGARLLEALPESLPREHERTFGHTISKEAPPYETSYGASHIFMQTNELADIAGFYRAFGLEPRQGERLDHLAAELEFMQFLIVKEGHASDHAGPEQVEICRDAQRSFLREHLGRWVGAFATAMVALDASPFYARLAGAIADFVKKECDALQVQPVPVSAAELRVPEADSDNACGSCDLSKAL